MTARELTFDHIKVGDSASFERTILAEDVSAFATLSGDASPLHVDADYAAQTEFKEPVIAGMFLAALASRLVGMELPGMHALLVKANLDFKSPARINDQVTVTGEVTHKSAATKLIEIALRIQNKDTLLVSGILHVKVRV